MKKIVIAYWHLTKMEISKYEHKQEITYTPRKRNQIVKYFLDLNLSVMLIPQDEELHIWVDSGRFRQR